MAEQTRGIITIEVGGDWEYSARDMLDWIEMKLSQRNDLDWGAGRGGINYAKGRVAGVQVIHGKP